VIAVADMSSEQPTTLGAMAERNATTRANDVAFVHEGRASTYAAHFERASRLASAWRALRLRTQDRIAILSQNRTEFCEVCTASEIGGFITVTLNFRLSGP
jgi:acyl-CoA synthetase (AMP-forming)/AMP-acid ligase II